MTKEKFIEKLKNGKRINFLSNCKNARICIDDVYYFVPDTIFDDDINDILNTKEEVGYIICRDKSLPGFVPAVDWVQDGEIISVE